MTRHSILEYVKAVKPRYKRVSKEAKTSVYSAGQQESKHFMQVKD